MSTKSPASPLRPPPPPPPLPSSRISADSESPQSSNILQLLDAHPEQCSWTSDPEIKVACILARICTEKSPYRIKYTKFKAIAQVGPTCGLVALSMLIYGKITPDQILKVAKNEGYTSYGEMLSCKNMAKMAKDVLTSVDIGDMSVKVHSRGLFSPETVESLLNGAVLLVPYDSAVNHTPALYNGRTAHWAVICGVILVNEPAAPYTVEKENIFVLSRHGKSKFLCAWNLAQLAQSNNNLWQFSPRRRVEESEYVIPEGGMGGNNGLRGQYITLQLSN